jgi:hypothetical protein
MGRLRWFQKQSAPLIEHVGNHEQDNEAKDKIGLKLMAAFISVRSPYGPSENSHGTCHKNNQFEQIFEGVVKRRKFTLHEGTKKRKIQSLTYQINGPKPKDHKTPEYNDMYHTSP